MSARTRAGTGAFGRAARCGTAAPKAIEESQRMLPLCAYWGRNSGRSRSAISGTGTGGAILVIGADLTTIETMCRMIPQRNLTKVGFGGPGRSGIRARELVARNFLPHGEEISAPHVSTNRLRLQK